MSDINQLYSELILDHSKSPRNQGVLSPFEVKIEGFNPLCGDALVLYLQLDEAGTTIEKVSFESQSCAIATASISLMSEKIKGQSLDVIQAWSKDFQAMVKGESSLDGFQSLGKIKALQGVSAYPMRIKCATMGWHALDQAIQEALQTRGSA